MTTRALDELDGGLGSCPAGEELSVLVEAYPGTAQENKAPGSRRRADSGSCPPVSQELGADSVGHDRIRKTDQESAVRGALGPGRERPKGGTTPRSAPARKKAQATSPPHPPPPVPSGEELPWGDVSINKCLALASLLALLGSALQLCRDAVAGEATVPAPVPEPWVPPSPPRKEPAVTSPKPPVLAPPTAPPAPQADSEAEEGPEVPGSPGAAEQGPAGEMPTPLADRGLKDKRGKERPRREEKSRRERPRRESGAPREALPRRWEVRDSEDRGHRKRHARPSPRRSDLEERLLGRRKPRAGKGRD
ncbi:junctional sarcoplasmic reticulum protein 1 [Ochotona princeps]|uniref:junctional sarcoplasmic reticulum protein 1 n=1 Tax=Ochotona princeps TaxID=9978 RepID=UPI002714E71A|nr:junctional sarcoplasmic reticulum protein 1 [Ochotona princeps]XP_058513760.1 junctional sarcoplasmic reticulum protein 1 [Ochotona princeps]